MFECTEDLSLSLSLFTSPLSFSLNVLCVFECTEDLSLSLSLFTSPLSFSLNVLCLNALKISLSLSLSLSLFTSPLSFSLNVLCVFECTEDKPLPFWSTDIPGSDYRIATISGSPEGCQRAKKMVDDLVAEVHVYT